MFHVGDYNDLTFEKFVDFGAYLSDGRNHDKMILMPRKFVPEAAEKGEVIRAFVYLDSADRPVATTQKPKARVGDLALLRVKELTPVGAFLDWGLEKDLLVPFREQPHRMEAGKHYLVKLYLDKVTGRIVATRRLAKFYAGDVSELAHNQKVKAVVWDINPVGYRVIVDEKYTGIIYKNECPYHLKNGDSVPGFVHVIRKEENRVDIRLRQDGIAGVAAQQDPILEYLRENGGILPLTCNSTPEEIRSYFAMSKRTFKQAVGMLYKQRKIDLHDAEIVLTEENA